jgi:RNA methyltransferase, TrmH family
VGAAAHLQPLTRAQGSHIRELLRDKKTRSREGAFIVEGAKSCLDLIRQHPQSIRSIVVSPRYLRSERDADLRMRSQLGAPQYLCADLIFDKLTDVDIPQGMLAIVQQPRWDATQIFNQSRLLGIYGDRLQDPGNVGAIIRTAAALNLSGIWLGPESADPLNPKVVRATAGAILALPIFQNQDVHIFSRFGCEVYSALLPSAQAVPIRRIRKVPNRLVVAVGNEGVGLASEVVKASQMTFAIPLVQGVESLNVAATAAISAFYFSGLPCRATPISARPRQSA